MQVRCEKRRCGVRFELQFDALGRMVGSCPACARRMAGYCARCPSPVEGQRGRAKYCKPCKVVAHREQHIRYRDRDIQAYNARAAARVREKRKQERNGRPPMDGKAIGRLRGLARAKALTPERRREIAQQAVRTRWKKYYQRQMLQRMREASTS